jgi:hypothetical protein
LSNRQLQELKRQFFARLEAIERGEIPEEEIGSQQDEADKLDMGFKPFYEWCLEYMVLHHPEFSPEGHKQRIKELFDIQAKKKRRVFARLEAIDRGEVPEDKIGTQNEEVARLGISHVAYYKWGVEYIALHHPEVPPADYRRKLRSYSRNEPKNRRRVFARLEAIYRGDVPADQVGSQNEGLAFLGISITAYYKWGVEYIALQNPDLPVEECRKKLKEYSGFQFKKKHQIFARLDDIERGEVPGSQREEADELGVNQATFHKCALEWIALHQRKCKR